MILEVTENSANPLFGSNRLKLATFCTNNMTFPTNAPEIGLPSWDDILHAARLADAAGFEAIVPIARWKGYLDGHADHKLNFVLDPFIYAGAIAQATQHSAVFSTTHAPTMHPIVVAKQAATIDMISGGRFAMNIVGGWNRREFEMFGIELLDHDLRYDYLTEWLLAIRRLWGSADEFDLEGRFFQMKGAVSRPQPVQKPSIPIMNAGGSVVGQHFAACHADIALISIYGHSGAEWARQVADYKKLAWDKFQRNIQVWTNIIIVQRDSVSEAQAYLDHYSREYLDVEALDSFMATFARETRAPHGSPQLEFTRANVAIGSGYPVIGTADTISDQMRVFAEAGLDGVLMNWTNPIDGLIRFNRDVLPQLEAAGLRESHRR